MVCQLTLCSGLSDLLEPNKKVEKHCLKPRPHSSPFTLLHPSKSLEELPRDHCTTVGDQFPVLPLSDVRPEGRRSQGGFLLLSLLLLSYSFLSGVF